MQVKTPYIARIAYPSLVWDLPSDGNKIYITFDDGPHPEITPKVLEILDKYEAKASFFCVGENVKKFPEVYQMLIDGGHGVGNHSFNHLNGWKTTNKTYFENVEKAASLIKSNLFRPPYGKISPVQIKILKKKYKIIMWSVLSYDFNRNLSPSKCLENCIQNTESGSIVVFHDSEKSEINMFYALKGFLDYFSGRGAEFAPIKII